MCEAPAFGGAAQPAAVPPGSVGVPATRWRTGVRREVRRTVPGALIAEDIEQPDPDTAAVRAAFNAVFSALVLRVAYGPAFATPAVDDETFIETLPRW